MSGNILLPPGLSSNVPQVGERDYCPVELRVPRDLSNCLDSGHDTNFPKTAFRRGEIGNDNFPDIDFRKKFTEHEMEEENADQSAKFKFRVWEEKIFPEMASIRE
jgi:hypothetical protein